MRSSHAKAQRLEAFAGIVMSLRLWVKLYLGDAAGLTVTGELVDAGPVVVDAAGLAAGDCAGDCAGCDPVAFGEAGRKPRFPGLLSISAAR